MENSGTYKEFSNSSISDYYELLKPRVMSLVVFTGLVGMILAPGNIHPFIALVAVLCIAVGSGASGAINMWYERDLDAKMKRTENRPLPAGRVNPDEALGFGVIMALFSVIVLAIATNLVAAAILTAAICFYVFIYTIWLKRRTPQNIVIGGAAGSFPPMIGWAAVTGDITLFPILLFLIIFFWTPPHFWALSLLIKDEYKNATVPMLPVVRGVQYTKYNIVIYSLILAVICLLPYFFGFAGLLYLTTAILLNFGFIYYSIMCLRDNTNTYARKTFLFSIIFLFLLYLIFVADKIVSN